MNKTRKVATPKTDEQLERAIEKVKLEQAEAELQQAMEAIAAKHGVQFQFQLGGINIKAFIPQ